MLAVATPPEALLAVVGAFFFFAILGLGLSTIAALRRWWGSR